MKKPEEMTEGNRNGKKEERREGETTLPTEIKERNPKKEISPNPFGRFKREKRARMRERAREYDSDKNGILFESKSESVAPLGNRLDELAVFFRGHTHNHSPEVDQHQLLVHLLYFIEHSQHRLQSKKQNKRAFALRKPRNGPNFNSDSKDEEFVIRRI